MSRPFSRRQVVTGQLADYERTVRSRPVTITCRECGREETREQLPGAIPRYCSLCGPMVKARKNAERQRRWRERRRTG